MSALANPHPKVDFNNSHRLSSSPGDCIALVASCTHVQSVTQVCRSVPAQFVQRPTSTDTAKLQQQTHKQYDVFIHDFYIQASHKI